MKGLEFDTVFVVALENGVFPSYIVFSNDEEAEEERRIAYVAVTRAKNKLYLTNSKRRLLYGSINKNGLSKFLLEFTGADPYKRKPQLSDEYGIRQVEFEPKKEESEEPQDKNYKTGDYVIHKVYGEGIIVSLEGTIGKICFTSRGEIKTFDITHPAIRKK